MTDGPAGGRTAVEGPMVGLVVVSHSGKIAEGTVDLAGQMAGATRMIAAGGTTDGGIGTSFDTVSAAIVAADTGAGVVVLCDLGSAILTAETALDFLDDALRERVRIADAPIVEGSVAAAVAAQVGEDLASVVAAAEAASPSALPPAAPGGVPHPDPPGASESGSAVLSNRDGLHARPAAEFVKLVHTFEATVTVNGVDGRSLLRILSLGLSAGSAVSIEARGPDAAAAVAALLALIESGFGE